MPRPVPATRLSQHARSEEGWQGLQCGSARISLSLLEWDEGPLAGQATGGFKPFSLCTAEALAPRGPCVPPAQSDHIPCLLSRPPGPPRMGQDNMKHEVIDTQHHSCLVFIMRWIAHIYVEP